MTASLNRITLIGNLGNDAKTMTGKDGKSFVTATLATNESFKQNDSWQTHVEWHQLVLFGKLAKCAEYLKKGTLVYVEGKLRSNQWTDNDGIKRQNISVVVNNVQLLGQNKPTDGTRSKAAEHYMAEIRETLNAGSQDIPF